MNSRTYLNYILIFWSNITHRQHKLYPCCFFLGNTTSWEMIYHLGINTGDTVWSNLPKASGWKLHTLNALCNCSLILHSSCMSMEEAALWNLYHLLVFITCHQYLRSITQTIKAIEVNITPRMSSSLNTDNFFGLKFV